MALTFQTLSSKINPKYLKNNENNQAFQAKSFDGNDSFVKKSENNNNVSFTGRSEKFTEGDRNFVDQYKGNYRVYVTGGGIYSDEYFITENIEATKGWGRVERIDEDPDSFYQNTIMTSNIKQKYPGHAILKGENSSYERDSVNLYIADPGEKVSQSILDKHEFVIQAPNPPATPETKKTEKNTPSTVEQALKRIAELTEELTKLKNSLIK